MANARKTAVDALLRVERDGAYSNLILGQFLSKIEASKEDKALASAIFYGVLDRLITLDYFINKLSKLKVEKLQPLTRQVLRTALYQIYYMDKIPESAAVNEAVKIIKKSGESRNSGYVNAVLRSAVSAPVKLPEGRDLYSLSVRYSCPQWILTDIVKDYGIENAEEILKAYLLPSNVTLRVNTLKTTAELLKNRFAELGIAVNETEEENCLELCSGIDFSGNKLFKEGFFHIQDISSQKCALALKAEKGERILDVCAAPGGKSFTVAQTMNGCGEIVSCDLYENRVSLIKQGAQRLGINCIKAVKNDASAFNPELGEFDAVLCDVPCSGFGVIRRKPEIKYKPSDDFEELSKIQSDILSASSKYVKAGGRLIYSTCTVRKAENELIVKSFLENNSNFNCEYMHTDLPTGKSDGFFHALLVRK